jgi:ABC-type multidrug transport system fused ATPase/permease subunit
MFVCYSSHHSPNADAFLTQLDGELITDLNLQEYRKQIALVSQEPTLYAGSVRFNILLGAIKPAEEVTQEEIEDACRNANILEFIQSLPEYVFCPNSICMSSSFSQRVRY